MKIYTPADAAKVAGNKYLGILVAARFTRYLNDFPRDRLPTQEEKLTTTALEALSNESLSYKLIKRRRSEA